MIGRRDVEQVLKRLGTEVIEHRLLSAATNDLVTRLLFAIPGTTYLVVGAPGTGVHYLAREVRRGILKEQQPHDPCRAIELFAGVPSRGTFRYKTFWQAGLEKLHNPVYGQSRRASESPSGMTEYFGHAIFRGSDHFQTDFENAMQRRACSFVFILQAHNLLNRLRDDELTLPLRIFQQIARRNDQLPKAVVLAGRYGLLRMRYQDAAVDQHTDVLHVPLLPISDPKGVVHCIEFLNALEHLLGELIEPRLLVEHAPEFCERICGAPGWGKRTVVRALQQRVQEKHLRPLNWKSVAAALPDGAEQDSLQREIEYGCKLLNRAAVTGKKSPPTGHKNAGNKHAQGKVGIRAPSRDPVGDTGS